MAQTDPPSDAFKLRLRIPLDSGMRLDQLLLAELRKTFPDLSRSALKSLFRECRVLVADRPVRADSTFPPGSEVAITLLHWNPAELISPKAIASPDGCFLPILYEDEELLVFNKLSGVASVPLNASESRTAVNAALAHAPSIARVGRGGLEPGLLHRLDTGTSGILVFAKTDPAFTHLQGSWKSVRKWYQAICSTAPEGKLPKPQTIRIPLGHDAKSAKRMLPLFADGDHRKIRGAPLPAVTHLREVRAIAQNRLQISVEIETGVMHQIRSHLSAIGHPIAGDSRYGGVASERLWLHAWKIELPLTSGAILRLTARLPDDWPG